MIDRRDRGKLLVVGAIVASLVLVGVYLAAGGASYAPEKTQDPCKPRAWRNPQGLEEIAEQFSLSALDGAACQLGVSRETLARALATPKARERFTKSYGIDDAKLAKAIRAGLLRAVDDAEERRRAQPAARRAAARRRSKTSRSTRRSNWSRTPARCSATCSPSSAPPKE